MDSFFDCDLNKKQKFDSEHLWHPYAALKNTPARFLAKSAHGTTIETADGLKLIDYEFGGKPFSVYGNEDAKILLVTYGREFSYACFAKEKLAAQGIDICILKLNTILPLPVGALMKAKPYEDVYFFEEGVRSGGLGEYFGFCLYQMGFVGRYHLAALSGCVPQAKTDSALHKAGLDSKMIEIKIKNDVSIGGKANALKKKT